LAAYTSGKLLSWPHLPSYFRKQVKTLGRYFMLSFFWGFFQWFFSGGDDCGFKNFPTLGLEAYNNRSEMALPVFFRRHWLWFVQYLECLELIYLQNDCSLQHYVCLLLSLLFVLFKHFLTISVG
jgi:hypothetical protein